jgi:hypothetical protein
MKQSLFMDKLDVAWDDFRADAPHAVGMAIIILHRTEDDELEMQMAGNVPSEVLRHALVSLVRTWQKGGAQMVEGRPPKRRKVV